MKTEHNWYTGEDCTCDPEDEYGQRCWVCINVVDGGLGVCKTCGGIEGTLTTDCCGRKLTEYEEKHIYEVGDLDFKDGEWISQIKN